MDEVEDNYYRSLWRSLSPNLVFPVLKKRMKESNSRRKSKIVKMVVHLDPEQHSDMHTVYFIKKETESQVNARINRGKKAIESKRKRLEKLQQELKILEK